MLNRRDFLRRSALLGAGLALYWKGGILHAKTASGSYTLMAAANGPSLDSSTIPKYATPLVIPPAMPRRGRIWTWGGGLVDYYEIAVRQFEQQILPDSMPETTVWSYGSLRHPGTFNYPAFTIEARHNRPVRVKWINDLVDGNGNYRPHILPVDQTLHWANVPAGNQGRDMRGSDPTLYTGPVPLVTHVHGAHTHDESDGYTEAWYLPNANNIPRGYAREGSKYDYFKYKFLLRRGVWWKPGTATFQYPNDQAATTLWYHDHSLGLTRVNVYAGPAGFYIIRGGPNDLNGKSGVKLPGPAPQLGDAEGTKYYEIPIVIQDRSFNEDGSLFYPDNRAFFEGLETNQLPIDFSPKSDIAPIWNPEFFGDTMIVNGNSWPYLDVEPRRYRFRLLNGCNSRFLILKMEYSSDSGAQTVPFWQIGAEGGFLPSPVQADSLLMAPAERADVIVDFTGLPDGTSITMLNLAPDEPFGGGDPDLDFDIANPVTTGQVMQFKVIPLTGVDDSTDPAATLIGAYTLPTSPKPPAHTVTRVLTLNEESSTEVMIVVDFNTGEPVFDSNGSIVTALNVTPVFDEDGKQVDDNNKAYDFFGPRAALLGTEENGVNRALLWMDPITENPKPGATELWEIKNFTMDAHPIHVHLVQFEVVDRQPLDANGNPMGIPRGPEPTETGMKDTVIAYPGEVTRIKATFDTRGLFVWHCHIVEHEDNEMMRPYLVSHFNLLGSAEDEMAGEETTQDERFEEENFQIHLPFVSR